MTKQPFNWEGPEADLIDEVSEADRIWFEENPTRNFRVRRYKEGEFTAPAEADFSQFTDDIEGAPPAFRYTLVSQLQPGFRVRSSFISRLPPEELSERQCLLIARWVYAKGSDMAEKMAVMQKLIKQKSKGK